MFSQNLYKLQNLMREVFRLHSADLDFGIYRILHCKKNVIEEFINDQLPNIVANELETAEVATKVQANENLQAAKQNILLVLGEEAFDANGILAEQFHTVPVGRDYLSALAEGNSLQTLAADVYNHLYTFFSRYYENGDFIPRRRYSRNERYAIPYNGEEVHLHWVNKDQHYIKTEKYFQNYD